MDVKYAAEDCYSEHKIGDRAGGNYCRSFPYVLGGVTYLLLPWLSRELLDAAVDRGVFVRAPASDINYIAGKIVLDVLYERRSPFNPSEAVAEIVALMRQYRCTKIVGDKYGAQWTVEAFARAGARYEPSELDRSAICMNCLPIFTSGRARLLDNQKMVSQFAALKRRTRATMILSSSH